MGLAGAFLLQRLFAQRDVVGPRREQIRRACNSLKNDVEGELAQVDEVLSSLRLVLSEMEKRREIGQPLKLDLENVSVLDPGSGMTGVVGLGEPTGFDGESMLRSTVVDIEAYAEILRAQTWESLVGAIRTDGNLHGTLPWEGERRPSQQVAAATSIWAKIETQRFAINSRWGRYQDAARLQADNLTELRSMLVPKSLWFLFAILLGLLVFSVILPMTYLSAKTGDSKTNLLYVFAPLSVAFVGYFGFELYRLRRADRLESDVF